MANKFKLNTVQVPGLTQVLLALPTGKVFDYLVQNVAGVVTNAIEREEIEIRRHETATHKSLVEE